MDDEKYRCPISICRHLMIDACQTINCGHRFCESCLKRLFEEEEKTGRPATCPENGCGSVLRGEDGLKYYPDRSIQKEVRNLAWKCKINKCTWDGFVGMLEDHLQQCHPSYAVKPVKRSEGTHVLVDKRHMEATQSTHHYLKKYLGNCIDAVNLLGEAIESQTNMETVVRESADVKQQSAAQSTISLGPAERTTLKERSLTLNAERPNFHPHKMEQVLDTSSLTQVDQAMVVYGHSPNTQEVPIEHQITMHHHVTSTATDGDQSAAAACAQTDIEKPFKRRRRSNDGCETAVLLPVIKGKQASRNNRTTTSTLPLSLPQLVPKTVKNHILIPCLASVLLLSL